MHIIRQRIQQVLEIGDALPSDKVSIAELDPSETDVIAYQKATKVIHPYRRLVKLLRQCNYPHFDEEFEDLSTSANEQSVKTLGEIRSGLQTLVGRTGARRDIQAGEEDIEKIAARLVQKIDSGRSQLAEILNPLIAKVNVKSLDVERIENLFQSVSSKLEEIEQITTVRQEKNSALLVGEKVEDYFEKVIVEHKDAAHRWFISFCWACGLTALLLIVLWLSDPKKWFEDNQTDMQVLRSISFLTSKVVVATFAISICFISARMYQNHVHNWVTARQRKAAFLAFTPLYESIPVNDTSNARIELSSQAAQAIFALGNSAFVGKENSDLTKMLPPLAEIVKSVKS